MILSQTNIYVLTKTKGRQNLIFSGKLCNVFCQDPIFIENKPDSFFLNKKKDYIYRIRNNSLVSPNDISDIPKRKNLRKNVMIKNKIFIIRRIKIIIKI